MATNQGVKPQPKERSVVVMPASIEHRTPWQVSHDRWDRYFWVQDADGVDVCRATSEAAAQQIVQAANRGGDQ